MLLAIDIGNTNTVIGLLTERTLHHRWRISSDSKKTSDEFAILLRELCGQSGVELEEIGRAIVCSVVPSMTTAFVGMCEGALGIEPVIVGPDLDLGIEVDYADPYEVGPDRLANAVAVHELVDGPAIVVDFGTATTFDVVTADGHYAGGAIAPGLLTSVETLFARAALLHRVSLEPVHTAIGRTTEDSLRSGIVYGGVGQVDEIVRRIVKEWGEDPTVVATGGLADRMALVSETIDMVEPDLTLLGLALIHERATAG